MSDYDWLIPGRRVAIIRGHTRNEAVTFTTIERVLKRDVVLDNGERFTQTHRWNGGLVRRGDTWSPGVYLYPDDHETVVRTKHLQDCRAVASRVESLMRDWKESRFEDDQFVRRARTLLNNLLDADSPLGKKETP